MSKKRKKNIWLTIAAVSVCFLAALGGYKGSRLLADEITTEAEMNAEKAGLFKPSEVEKGISAELVSGEKTINKLRPTNLIYVVDYETGKVQKIALEVFDTVSMIVSLVYLDVDISYTMTGTLYRALTNENVLVPQTVKLSELYSYYGNASAYDAGRKIISELLDIDIDYYTAVSKESAPEELLIGRMTSLGLKEVYEVKHGKDTNITAEDDAAFSKLCLYLADSDIKGYEAPVIRRNESSFADIIGIWEILRKINIYMGI